MAKSIIILMLILSTLMACSKSVPKLDSEDKQIVDLMITGFKQGFQLDKSTVYYWPIEIRIMEKGILSKEKGLPLKVYMKGTRLTTNDSVKKPLTGPPANGKITEGTDVFYMSRNDAGKMKITFADKSLLIEQQ